MTQSDVLADSGEVFLLRGAMQNWSDLAIGSVGDAGLVRRLLDGPLSGVHSVLVVGAHSLELIAGLAQSVQHLTIVTRSIPDARAFAQAVGKIESVTVYCGAVDDLVERGLTFQVVVALDDLDRVISQEASAPAWADVLGQISRLTAPGGVLLLGVENEFGLHRLGALRSRYTANDDSDWAVLATYDASRPRTHAQLLAAAESAGLAPASLSATYTQWLDPSIMVENPDRLHRSLRTVLGLACSASLCRSGLVADTTRMTRIAADIGLIDSFASGWLLQGRKVGGLADPGSAARDGGSRLSVDTGESIVNFQVVDGEVHRHDDSGAALVSVTDETVLLSEELLDACAAHLLTELRGLLREYVDWLRGASDGDELDLAVSAAALDNVFRTESGFEVLLPGSAPMTVDERAWRSMGEFVAIVRRRGARHPWPAATDDLTLVSILGAMAGLDLPQDLTVYVVSEPLGEGQSTHSVAALLAVVSRQEESLAAIQSRAAWFERRLGERERELRSIAATHDRQLRVEQAKQEALRRNVSDIKGSVSYRAGRKLMAPMLKAREAARRLRD